MCFNFKFAGKLMEQNIPEDILKIYKQPRHFDINLATSHEVGPIHIHDYMQLWYVVSGTFKHFFNDKYLDQRAGDFLFVPPYYVHRIDSSESQNVKFIFIDLAENFLSIFPESNDKNTLFNLAYLRPLFINAESTNTILPFSGEAKNKIESLLYDMLNEYSGSHELSGTYLRANIIKLLSLVAREYESIAPQKDDALFANYRSAIQNALDYIDKHYTENIYLEDISKIAIMSVRSFSFVFKQITGKTFIEYLNYLRIRHARKLLLDTDKSVLNICCECGFYDMAYFSRIFKKTTGYPPSVYRKLQLL